ncbi:MAG TPA: hypothetical protein VIG24_13890, partial [Acidimicrobiia bacterium]
MVARVLVGFGLWVLALPALTLLLGVPSAAKIVVVQSKGWAVVYLLGVIWWQSAFGPDAASGLSVLDTLVWFGAGAFG